MRTKPAVNYFAVIPAAGAGTRMQGTVPKQYLEINGTCVIEHTLNVLLKEPRISELMVCLAPGDRRWAALGIANHSRVSNTVGGDSRAVSVLNGLAAIADRANPHDWVLVHDAARPCLSSHALKTLLDNLAEHHSGGILALPARDTIKLANSKVETPSVKNTLDRSLVWQAQTPQMFRYDLLNAALTRAISGDGNSAVTDEASAMEMAGHEVKLIQGEPTNLKITTSDDLALAEYLLSKKG